MWLAARNVFTTEAGSDPVAHVAATQSLLDSLATVPGEHTNRRPGRQRPELRDNRRVHLACARTGEFVFRHERLHLPCRFAHAEPANDIEQWQRPGIGRAHACTARNLTKLAPQRLPVDV